MFGFKFTPVAFFMIPLAMGLDLVGIILLCCGLDDFGLIDIVWIAFSTPCYLLCPQKTKTTSKSGLMGWIEKIFTGKWSKFLTPDIGGIIPGFGNMIPFRTISAFLNTRQ